MSDDRGLPPDLNGDDPFDESELYPSLAMPSPRIYRGSLIALLIGSIFAVWLLVFPPVGADRDSPPASIDGIVAGAMPQPTATSEPTAEPTMAATATPASTVATTPEATATVEPEPELVIYTVVPGDTMLAIAELYLPAGREINEFVDAIAQANGIFDITQIQIGQVLEIPGQ